MTLRCRTIAALLTVSAAGGCSLGAASFCDVVAAPYSFDPVTAAAMVRTDRAHVVRLDAQNAYWRANCVR
jgi:hypothetical protein